MEPFPCKRSFKDKNGTDAAHLSDTQARSQADVSGVAKLYWTNHVAQNLQNCILGTLTFNCDGV